MKYFFLHKMKEQVKIYNSFKEIWKKIAVGWEEKKHLILPNKTDRLTWTIVCITSLGTWWKSYTVRSTVLRGRVSTWPWPRLQSAPACHRAGSVRSPTCPLTVDCELMNLDKIDSDIQKNATTHEQVTKKTHYMLTFLICIHFSESVRTV